jgi:hypothetical protein
MRIHTFYHHNSDWQHSSNQEHARAPLAQQQGGQCANDQL